MKLAQAVSFLGIVGIVANVVATPITGDIVFSGAYSTDKADLSQSSKFTLFHDVSVVGSTGAYAVVPANFSGAIYNVFAFDPVSPALPYIPLWTFNTGSGVDEITYSFDLTSLTIQSRSALGMHLTGAGGAHITGFEDTVRAWDLFIEPEGKFRFSTAVSVPDAGSTGMLVGTAFLLIGVARRRFC